MPRDTRSAFNRQLSRFERRLPSAVARSMTWLRQPGLVYVRLPVAMILILIGTFGVFLPPLGLVPLGLVLIALNVPYLRPPLIRLLAVANRYLRRDADEARSRGMAKLEQIPS